MRRRAGTALALVAVLLVLPLALAPLVARLVPGWHPGGVWAVFLATLAGLGAALWGSVRLARCARPHGGAAFVATLVGCLVGSSLWLLAATRSLAHATSRVGGVLCDVSYPSPPAHCPGGAEIYYGKLNCLPGSDDTRIAVRTSFLPLLQPYGQGSYGRLADVPGPVEICADLAARER